MKNVKSIDILWVNVASGAFESLPKEKKIFHATSFPEFEKSILKEKKNCSKSKKVASTNRHSFVMHPGYDYMYIIHCLHRMNKKNVQTEKKKKRCSPLTNRGHRGNTIPQKKKKTKHEKRRRKKKNCHNKIRKNCNKKLVKRMRQKSI